MKKVLVNNKWFTYCKNRSQCEVISRIISIGWGKRPANLQVKLHVVSLAVQVELDWTASAAYVSEVYGPPSALLDLGAHDTYDMSHYSHTDLESVR